MTDRAKHDAMANAIRALSMDAVQAANSGHPGLPMGGADIATVLFTKFLKFDPKAPHWPDRDRFVLSAGHGSMLLYSLLYLLGYEDMSLDDIKNFRQLGYKTAGHPEYGHAGGIETTTGPLGQGLGNSVGMAIAEAKLRAEFGADLVNHYTYVYAGDGCLMEGISQEAIALAGHLKLKKLIVIWDNNDITIDGKVGLADSTDQRKRFEASGWHTIAIDGHNPDEIEKALTEAQKSDKPTLIDAKTTIGFGSPNKAGTNKVHGSALGDEELALAKAQLGWEYGPFEIPEDIMDAWRLAGNRGTKERSAWTDRLNAADSEIKSEFERRQRGALPAEFKPALEKYKKQLAEEKPKLATRASSQNALEVINGVVPETLGGSADLTGSNNTKTSQTEAFTTEDRTGRYIHYGIREHGMVAAMNGIALHGGFYPYGGTFMCFTDYCRPSIRLAALMGVRIGLVMTHDSIGLGEDGPTHQPVEHLAALRAIPNLRVFRPADAMEAAECWELAIEHQTGPSLLALSRQGLPALRTEYSSENLSARGAYTLWGDKDAQAVIFGTGSETQFALDAAKQLTNEGISARAVSVPSFELFAEQPDDYKRSIFGNAKARVAIEAGVEQGWDKFLGPTGRFVGMSGFGASGKIEDLYPHFGITTQAVVEAAKAQL
ncbi:transketolase [Pelagibacterium xiamenense]|uniref:transketolase n=1 Tax=Pelagibacterium xiamenense TaxID=2901140 RepID=UPI001E2C58E4|nr:transketolase [Pelagibacterium xiamenense]MCD7060475.1 transketolase [Pelagibacterium xiamenense]